MELKEFAEKYLELMAHNNLVDLSELIAALKSYEEFPNIFPEYKDLEHDWRMLISPEEAIKEKLSLLDE